MTSLNAGDTTPSAEKFDAREVINEAVKRHEKRIRDRLQLNVKSQPAIVNGNDRAKVERVFQNIFNNAAG
jgi:signal transduction histidine kinase